MEILFIILIMVVSVVLAYEICEIRRDYFKLRRILRRRRSKGGKL